MKEVKLKERFENAIESFFEDERFEKESLSMKTSETDLPTEKKSFFSEKSKKVFNICRQLFLFLPANFLLFMISIVYTAIFILRPFGEAEGQKGFINTLPYFLLFAALTTLGLGNWRNPKHYLIPISTILTGIIFGIVGSIIFGDSGFGVFFRNYIPYLLPIAFIVPVLVKSWVDKEENQ